MRRIRRTGAAAPVHALLFLLLLAIGCSPGPDRPNAGVAPAGTPAVSAVTAAGMGYTIEPPPTGQGEIRILRHGDVVWTRPAFYGGVHGEPEDLTGDSLPNLLLSHPRGRSFRGYTLLELGPDGVRVLWSVEVHASQVDEVRRNIFDRLREGRSLADPPPRPR